MNGADRSRNCSFEARAPAQQDRKTSMTAYENYRSISVERRGPILVLTLDRPQALNAVNADLHGELARIFVDVRRDPDARVVDLTGQGRAFCAGGDIDWMQAA